MKNTTYLGDGVYVQLVEEHILLTTGNHEREKADNEIFLEEEVFVNFMGWCKRSAIPCAVPPPDSKTVAEENATLAVERATDLKTAQATIEKLRLALQGLVGVSSREELEQMRAFFQATKDDPRSADCLPAVEILLEFNPA